MMNKISVLEELRLRKLAVIQEEICFEGEKCLSAPACHMFLGVSPFNI